ncbi:MAG: hypothetical protein GXN92_03580 [Candidatus Micrarchaeota archaeon]|nr:hypothetical protein [Candidatus Micrarchaeota archaeon]
MARMYVVSTRWGFQPSRGKIVKRQRLKGWLREDGELLTWPRIHNMPVHELLRTKVVKEVEEEKGLLVIIKQGCNPASFRRHVLWAHIEAQGKLKRTKDALRRGLLNPIGFKLPEEVDVSSPLERALQALVEGEIAYAEVTYRLPYFKKKKSSTLTTDSWTIAGYLALPIRFHVDRGEIKLPFPLKKALTTAENMQAIEEKLAEVHPSYRKSVEEAISWKAWQELYRQWIKLAEHMVTYGDVDAGEYLEALKARPFK